MAIDRRLRKRMLIMLIAVAILLGGLIGFNVFKNIMIKKFMAKGGLPPATVSTMVPKTEEWQAELTAVGTVRAVRGVEVTSEVAGLVRSVNFRSGEEVPAARTLIELNAETDIAQLHVLEAAAELAASVYERDRAQFAAQIISRAQLDADAADLKAKRAQVAVQAALIAKKTIRAPFAGKLGISTVNRGQYVNPGDKLVTLQTIDPIYVDFTLPQMQLPQVAVGQRVTLSTDAYQNTVFVGKINAINPRVDASTRNVQVEATLANAQRKLLPGMFATVTVKAGRSQHYLTLPQTAITYNPYGATVFVVKRPELVAQQVFVTAGPRRGDQVAILAGITPGTEVVTSGQVKLKNGTPLNINNSVQPLMSPNPKPQED